MIPGPFSLGGENMALKKLVVVVGANIDEFAQKMKQMDKDLKKIEKQFSGFEKMGKRLSDVGKTLTVGLTVPIVGLGAAASKMAMDVVESENLYTVSMGKMAKAGEEWSKSLRQSLGLNEYEVRKNLGVFNNMFTSMSLGADAAFEMSKGLTQLAYDMASFYNLNTEEAFQKLQAGITGEVEPLKRLGIIVNETTIKSWALRNGLIKQGETLNEQGKILARYGVIMEATKNAQGDLARTLDSPANKLRIMKEQIAMTAAEFGMALLPTVQALMQIVKPLTDTLSEWAKAFAALPAPTQKTVGAILLAVAALGPLLVGIGKLIAFVPKLISGLSMIKTALKGTAGTVLGLIVVLGIWKMNIATLVQKWDEFKEFFRTLWHDIVMFALNGAESVLKALYKLTRGLPLLGETTKNALSGVMRAGMAELRSYAEYEEAYIARMEAKAKQAKAKPGSDAFADMKKQAANIAKLFSGINASVADTSNKLEDWTAPTLEVADNLKTGAEAMAEIKEHLKEAAEFLDDRSPSEKMRQQLEEMLKTLQDMRKTIMERIGAAGEDTGISRNLAKSLLELDKAIAEATKYLRKLNQKEWVGLGNLLAAAGGIAGATGGVRKKGPSAIAGAITGAQAGDMSTFWRDFTASLKNALLETIPIANNAIKAAMENAIGGPLAMAGAAIMSLVMSSKTFGDLLNIINPILQALANAVGSFLEPLLPLIQVISTTLSPVFQVLGVILSNLILPVMRLLFPVFKIFGLAVLGLAIGIGEAWNAIASAINWLLGWLGVHLGLIDTPGLKDSFNELKDLTWESAMAMGEAADAARDLAHEFNVVRGFKRATYEWGAATPAGGSGIAALGAGGQQTVINIQGDVYGYDDFARKVREATAGARITTNRAQYGMAGA